MDWLHALSGDEGTSIPWALEGPLTPAEPVDINLQSLSGSD